MNIMITGCAGFIGSHAVEKLLSCGYEVIGVDCMTYAASEKNMENFIEKIKFYKVDITNQNKIREIIKECNVEWILNFAAETHVDNSINSAVPFLHSNINGVYSLLEACKIEGCKLFQISTDEVYGPIVEGSFVEENKLNPRNPYSATKAAAEHLVTSYYNTYGLEYKMVRMSNNFGPRQHKEKFIPTIIRSLKQNKKIPIYGDGKNIRDWFYVKDCVSCILEVFKNGCLNETYNLSFRDERENIEVVKTILDIMDYPFNENVQYVKDRAGHDFRYSISNDKFLSLREAKPADFRQSLVETIETAGE